MLLNRLQQIDNKESDNAQFVEVKRVKQIGGMKTLNFTDEKDYIMRMIKEMVRVLFSLAFGKKYVSVELEKETSMKYLEKI